MGGGIGSMPDKKMISRVNHTIMAGIMMGLGLICILGTSGGGSGGLQLPTQYSITGTVQAPDNMLVDSDVNDPGAPYESNDEFNTAQILTNPAIVGGYVNVPGAGFPGRSDSIGDQKDIYRTTLATNQIVTLISAAPSSVAHLSLFLYRADDTATPVDFNQDASTLKTVTAGQGGDYYIEVRAESGHSNYNLTIGQSAASITAQHRSHLPSVTADFVPGEVIVKFKDPIEANPGKIGPLDRAASIGLRHRAGKPGHSMLMGFSDTTARKQVFKSLGIRKNNSTASSVGVLAGDRNRQDTLDVVRALRNRSDVIYAEPNYIRRATAVPDDAQYIRQWHYPMINLPQAWDQTTGSDAVIVAVIDTGVLLNHPDLQGRLVDGYDFISDPLFSLDGDGIDDNPDDPGDQALGGSTFHGTHVAGTVGATTDNMTGVAGVTWATKIMPLRVLGFLGGTSYDINQAILYASGLDNDSGTVPTQRADIINMSLGGADYSAADQDVINQARAAGVIIIAAAGNESDSAPSYPAGYDGVVSVSAVNIEAKLAWYSNFGLSIDVAAPGGDTLTDLNNDGFPDGVLSTAGDDTGGTIEFVYSHYDGTSMAAPHVAGVAALMKGIYPQLTPAIFDLELEAQLITQDLGATGWDNWYGHGLIDALKAVQEAQRLSGGGGIPAAIVTDPKAINIGSGANVHSSIRLSIHNGGEEDLIIDSVSVDPAADWVTVAEANVDVNGVGDYTVNIDSAALSPGLYATGIKIVSHDTSDVIVPVSLRKGFFIGGGNAGFHYVILVDAFTERTVTEVDVGFSSTIGGYPFALMGVSPGQYLLFAGTDLDNDGDLGDRGESFGAFLTTDQPTTLNIQNNMMDLNFNTGFDISLPSGQQLKLPQSYGTYRLLSK